MKRSLSIITISIFLLLSAVGIFTSCGDETEMGGLGQPFGDSPILLPESEGLEFELSEDERGYLVAGIGSCTDNFIVIPEVYDSLPVIGIKDFAFEGNELIKQIKFPENLKKIGNAAFRKCALLSQIAFSEGLTLIGESAFSECSSLKSISLPASLTHIGVCAFLECSSLESVSVAESSILRDIGYGAFTSCTSLKAAYFPSSMPLVSIPAYCFENCTSLEEFVCPESVSAIYNYAFANCQKLSSLHIGKSVESIGENSLMYCGKLKDISVSSENQHYIAENGCLLNAKKTVLYHGTGSSKIPSTVRIIAPYAFSSCLSLNSITFPESLEVIERGAFEGCSRLQKIVIPDGVTSLGESAFLNCECLTHISLPASLTSVAYDCFYGCCELDVITVDIKNEVFTSEGNALTNKQTGVLMFGTQDSFIPACVTSIAARAFEGHKNLIYIDIPKTVTAIGKDAFKNCEKLAQVYLYHSRADDLTLREGIFSGCTALETICFYGRLSEWEKISNKYNETYNTPWYADCSGVYVKSDKDNKGITYS